MELLKQKNKKIGIFGLAISGIAVFKAIENVAAEIVVWDDNELSREKFIKQNSDKYLKSIDEQSWLNLDKIVLSPGIPDTHYIFTLAKKNNIKISSDIELFIEENPNSDIISITGTNGKSTTTALIGHILKESGLDYHVGGNIGTAVLSLPKNAQGYVLELSSFQLDLLSQFNPKISILLNITPDHLDRYKTFTNYYNSKLKSLDNNSMKIIGTNSEASKKAYNQYINDKKNNNSKIITINDTKNYTIPNNPYLLGKHNQENITAAMEACKLLGLAEIEIKKHIASFKGLEHRMQYLGAIEGIKFYNDSKATNLNSTLCALSSLKNIFWLVGGIFKEDKIEIPEKILANIKKAYLFGKNKDIFAKYLSGKIEYDIIDDMISAFNQARIDAENFLEKEKNILLSPACASFDQFKNFVDRGNKFIEMYNNESKRKK